MVDITVTTRRDDDVAATVLAQAFADDPVTLWLQPDRRRHRQLFTALVRYAHAAPNGCDLAIRDGQVVGAALWDPPGHRQTTLHKARFFAAAVRGLRTRSLRGGVIDAEFAQARPAEPVWYLAQLGAPAKGLGVGSALLADRLARIDGPAYLESSNEANVPLYERFGFRVRQEIVLPMNGPTCWTMYRPAQDQP